MRGITGAASQEGCRMKAELVAEQTVALPTGLVRLTLARHDDGHYSGVATLMQNGQRIGLLESEPPLAGLVPVREARVDTAVVGPEVRSVIVVQRDGHGPRAWRARSLRLRWER
jgi:hypothetical protein